MAQKVPAELKNCRSCYDHLAGVVGVAITEKMEESGWIKKAANKFDVTGKGWEAFEKLGIERANLSKSRRPLTRQCMDWTEKKPHLAGLLGAEILKKMLEKKWLKRVDSTRVIKLTVDV